MFLGLENKDIYLNEYLENLLDEGVFVNVMFLGRLN
jgi:hypothetical protein